MKPNSKTQSDAGLGFDGAELIAPKHSNKWQTNQYSGTRNDGALINKGRGPTKGNQDYDANQGAHREPPTAALPSTKIGNVDKINAGPQYRGVGGTTNRGFGNSDRINVGRGPTKGNQQ